MHVSSTNPDFRVFNSSSEVVARIDQNGVLHVQDIGGDGAQMFIDAMANLGVVITGINTENKPITNVKRG